MNLNELNEEIMLSEKVVLERELKLVDTKKSFDYALLDANTELEKQYADTKDKDLSNAEKRGLKACQVPLVVRLQEIIKKENYEIEVLKIECRHKLRNFSILIKSELI